MSIRTYSIFANCKEVGTFLSTLNGAKIMARRLQAALPHASVALRKSQGPVNVAVTGNQRHRVLLANAKKALAPSTRVHIFAHNLIAPLWHPGNIITPPEWLKSNPQHT